MVSSLISVVILVHPLLSPFSVILVITVDAVSIRFVLARADNTVDSRTQILLGPGSEQPQELPNVLPRPKSRVLRDSISANLG